jgi:hypothetical protein
VYTSETQSLDREEQVIVDYLQDHNGGSWLKGLSEYFSQKTGLKNRRTLWKKLKTLYEKDIVISRKSYGKETYVALVGEDKTIEVLDSQIKRLCCSTSRIQRIV